MDYEPGTRVVVLKGNMGFRCGEEGTVGTIVNQRDSIYGSYLLEFDEKYDFCWHGSYGSKAGYYYRYYGENEIAALDSLDSFLLRKGPRASRKKCLVFENQIIAVV